jgi:hypothetical protein
VEPHIIITTIMRGTPKTMVSIMTHMEQILLSLCLVVTQKLKIKQMAGINKRSNEILIFRGLIFTYWEIQFRVLG